MGTAVTIGLPFARTPVDYLQMAIRSVFAQTHEDWELLLLVDGELPDLEDLVSRIRDPRVRVVSDGHNHGLAARLNQVAREARHDVVLRMDGDDVMHPRRIELTLAGMAAHRAEVIGARAYAVDASTRLLGLFREGGLPAERAGFLRSNAYTHPTVAASRRWFQQNEYDESLRRSEDKDLWRRASARSTFAKIEDPVLFYRLTDLGPAKQAQDARYDRMLLRRHGPGLVGAGRTELKVGASHLKQRAFATLTRVGGEGVILRRKVTPLHGSELGAATQALRSASTAPVPGWS